MWKAKSGIIICILGCLFILRNVTTFTGQGRGQDLSEAPSVTNRVMEAQPAFTAAPAAPTFNSFPVGAGGADIIPHQIVRASNDKLYIFGYQGQFSSTIKAYWSNTAGLPTASTTYSSASLAETANPLSVEAAYAGANIIHILDNTVDGNLKDHIFDITTNTFKATFSIATGNPTIAGDYVGTSGLSALVGTDQVLNVTYWSSGNHITFGSYTYNDAALTLTPLAGSTQQIDTGGNANHPALAISPVDGSITVAWVSGAGLTAKILARTRSGGTWGSIEQVSAATPWTSTSFGINIDQGPSLLIDGSGNKHLAYIENYDSTNDYGRIHYVLNSGGQWADSALAAYTHDPALAINSAGEIYIIGHGHSNNASCTSNMDMCVSQKNPDNTWSSPMLFAAHTGNDSFDTSPSVKWSVTGYNRPETIEFIIPLALNGDYSNTILYYGSITGGTPPPPPPPPAVPTVSAISPTQGLNNVNTPVTISGTNFVATPTVKLGAASLTDVTWVSATKLTATVPAGMPGGLYDLIVTNPDSQAATLANAYTVQPVPVISSVSPSAADNAITRTITINGASFVATPAVKLGSTALTGVSFISASQLTAQVGRNTAPGTYAVTVTNPAGGSASLASAYTVTAAPISTPSLVVTNTSDSGNINLEGTLSYALDKAGAGQAITFNLSTGNTITINAKLPEVKPGVSLRYAANDPNPVDPCSNPIMLDSSNTPGGANLVLNGQNTIEGLVILSRSPGPAIWTKGTGNFIICTKVKLVSVP